MLEVILSQQYIHITLKHASHIVLSLYDSVMLSFNEKNMSLL